MKTYRIENWDILGCPHDDGKCHIGGQIYGHEDYADGTWVMSDHVVYFDNEKHQAQTLTSGLLQLGEMSEKMKQKDRDTKAAVEAEGITAAGGRPVLSAMHDNFMDYKPDDWNVRKGRRSGHHTEEAADALSDLLNQVFGRDGAPDKTRKH